nr:response regulator [Arsenophonus endosymbiont of Aleurodicus floccissimus]
MFLVDDVATNRDIISQMLIELGQMVYTADSGRAALNLGKKHIFDLVLMDIRIPDIYGIKVMSFWILNAQLLHLPLTLIQAKMKKPYH